MRTEPVSVNGPEGGSPNYGGVRVQAVDEDVVEGDVEEVAVVKELGVGQRVEQARHLQDHACKMSCWEPNVSLIAGGYHLAL